MSKSQLFIEKVTPMTDWTVPAETLFPVCHRLRLNPEVLCSYLLFRGKHFSRSQYFSITHQRDTHSRCFVASGAVLANTCLALSVVAPEDKMRAFVHLSNIRQGGFLRSRKVREIHVDITTINGATACGITTLLFEIIFHVKLRGFPLLTWQFCTYEYGQ